MICSVLNMKPYGMYREPTKTRVLALNGGDEGHPTLLQDSDSEPSLAKTCPSLPATQKNLCIYIYICVDMIYIYIYLYTYIHLHIIYIHMHMYKQIRIHA